MPKTLADFRQPFEELRKRITSLLLHPQALGEICGVLEFFREQAEYLATHDLVTYSINRRGEAWYINDSDIKCVAKIDLYDLKQANKVYGVGKVDQELKRLGFALQNYFPEKEGYLVCRSAGNDEFRLVSTSDTFKTFLRKMSQLHREDSEVSLIPWDYGIGQSEADADESLRNRKIGARPIVIRQQYLDNHSEIPALEPTTETLLTQDKFREPLQRAFSLLSNQVDIPLHVQQSLKEAINELIITTEQEIVTDYLTGALNAFGKKWYLDGIGVKIKGVALTDMLDMHEGNLKFGSLAIDQDLRRFAQVLLSYFGTEKGFRVVRSDKAGDEFKIYSSTYSPEQFREAFLKLSLDDSGKGLLKWNFGIGLTDVEAHQDLYRSRILSIALDTCPGKPMDTLTTAYLGARPTGSDYENLHGFSEMISSAMQGVCVEDLHCTLFLFRGVEDFPLLEKKLRSQIQRLHSFDIKLQGLARLNYNNSPGHIWLLAKKSKQLGNFYFLMNGAANDLGVSSAYTYEDWKPHIKIMILPLETPPFKSPLTLMMNYHLSFRVFFLEITRLNKFGEFEKVSKIDLL